MSSFSLDYKPYMALSQAFSSRNVTTHLPNVKKATDLIARENSKLKCAHSLLIIAHIWHCLKPSPRETHYPPTQCQEGHRPHRKRGFKIKMCSFSLDYNPYMALSQAFSSRNVTTHLPNVKKGTDLIARENSKSKWAHSLLIILYYYYVKKGTDLRKVLASSVKTSDRYEVKTKKNA